MSRVPVMSLPRYEARVGRNCQPGVECLGCNINDRPPPYVQPALTEYLVQGSPPPYNFVPNPHVQQIVTFPAVIQPHNPVTYHATFLKGKPKALGTVVIVAAILQIILGIAHAFSEFRYLSYSTGIMFWEPAIYITAGSLSIAAHPKPNIGLIRGSLAMNIISALTSAFGMILSGIDISVLASITCYHYHDHYHCSDPHPGPLSIVSVLAFMDILIFCVSVSTSAFGCRSLKKASEVPQVFVIQNGLVLPSPNATQPATFPSAPPPYPSRPAPPGGATK